MYNLHTPSISHVTYTEKSGCVNWHNACYNGVSKMETDTVANPKQWPALDWFHSFCVSYNCSIQLRILWFGGAPTLRSLFVGSPLSWCTFEFCYIFDCCGQIMNIFLMHVIWFECRSLISRCGTAIINSGTGSLHAEKVEAVTPFSLVQYATCCSIKGDYELRY